MMRWGDGSYKKVRREDRHVYGWLDDKKEMELDSGDAVYRLPELTTAERLRLLSELPDHPSIQQVHEKKIEILARRPAK